MPKFLINILFLSRKKSFPFTVPDLLFFTIILITITLLFRIVAILIR
jgi:hypothetical protein